MMEVTDLFCYICGMSMTPDNLAKDLDGDQDKEAGYDSWLKKQLDRAVEDLQNPNREEIDHTSVFEDIDAIIEENERQ